MLVLEKLDPPLSEKNPEPPDNEVKPAEPDGLAATGS